MSSPEKAMEGTSSGHSAPVNPALYDEAYFLSECEGYGEFIASGGQLLSRRLATALDSAEVEPGMRVLDVGCGRGESLIWLSRRGAMAWGLDYSSEALRIAKGVIATGTCEVESKCLLLSANARHLPFPAQSFDRVLMLDIVEHLHSWELEIVLREAHRVLAPDGHLVIHTAPNRWYYRFGYPIYRLYERLRGRRLPPDPRDRFPYHYLHVNEQDILSLNRLLRRVGFVPKVWLDNVQDPLPEGHPLIRSLLSILLNVYPFKWVFQNDIFAVACKRG